MSPRSKGETYLLAAVVVLTGVTLLYTFLIGQSLRLWLVGWLSTVVTLLSLYLAWRFVRAAERVADALE